MSSDSFTLELLRLVLIRANLLRMITASKPLTTTSPTRFMTFPERYPGPGIPVDEDEKVAAVVVVVRTLLVSESLKLLME